MATSSREIEIRFTWPSGEQGKLTVGARRRPTLAEAEIAVRNAHKGADFDVMKIVVDHIQWVES